jgi:hypothetical protein
MNQLRPPGFPKGRRGNLLNLDSQVNDPFRKIIHPFALLFHICLTISFSAFSRASASPGSTSIG